MKIIFDYKGERRYIIINSYYSVWEILECLEQQIGIEEIKLEYGRK